jgi:hypothetical protein
MQLTAVFETWHIGDGNYPPLYKGRLVNLSFELEPYSLAKLSSSEPTRFEQVKDAEYSFAGTVLRVYSDPPTDQLVVIQAGEFRFYINSFPKGVPSLKENDNVEGYGRLLLDHYIWVEFLSDYPDPPELFSPLRVVRIRSVKIPESFISRNEKGVSGPASLSRETCSTAEIQEVERIADSADSEKDWLFYLVDFDSSDVGTAKVPLTFRDRS